MSKALVYTFDYLMRQVDARKVKKPWRKMKRRVFKKLFRLSFDSEELFTLATNAKVGDIFCEHDENYRISEFYTGAHSARYPKGYPRWVPAYPNWRSYNAKDRPLRRGKIRAVAVIRVGGTGNCVCGCGHLHEAMSVEQAASSEILQLLYSIGATDEMYTRLKELRLPITGVGTAYTDGSECPPGYVEWVKNKIAEVDQQGPSVIVDEQGVLHAAYKLERLTVWKTNWEQQNGRD